MRTRGTIQRVEERFSSRRFISVYFPTIRDASITLRCGGREHEEARTREENHGCRGLSHNSLSALTRHAERAARADAPFFAALRRLVPAFTPPPSSFSILLLTPIPSSCVFPLERCYQSISILSFIFYRSLF